MKSSHSSSHSNLVPARAAAAAALACLAGSASGQYLEQRLTAADAAADAQFGMGVAVDGDTALIGASRDSAVAFWGGAAYVQERGVTGWAETQKLAPATLGVGDFFGAAVALDGDFAAVSAAGDDAGGATAGAVYVYERVGGTWTFAQKLIASDASAGSTFGSALALDGNVLAVGAASQSTAGFDRQGAVYIFERTAGSWQETDKLLAASPASLEDFGRALALDGDTLLVGAPRNDDNCPFPADCNTGAVHVFERGLVSWIGTGILYASDVTPEPAFFDQRFGRSVAISGERALVGAYGDDELGMDAGAVYAFEDGFAGWSPTQKIFSPSPTPLQDRFGLAVAIDAGQAVVGAPYDGVDAPLSGAAFVFDLAPGGDWIVGAELRPSDGAAFDDFGSGVDIAGGTVLAGAHAHDPGAGVGSGAAYVYDLESIGASYCIHTPSSLGVPATLGAFGSDSVGTNAFTLRAEPVPDQPGLFFFGQVQAQVPFGNGFLCIGPPLVRIEPPVVAVSGVATRSVDLALFGIVPGTYDFQYWFRDPAAGGAFFNLADAVEVVFGP